MLIWYVQLWTYQRFAETLAAHITSWWLDWTSTDSTQQAAGLSPVLCGLHYHSRRLLLPIQSVHASHTHTHTHTLYFHSTVHRRPSEVMNCVKNPSVLHFQFGRISAALLMIFPNTFVCSVIRSVASLTPHNILICGVPWLDLEWSRMWCNISTSRTFRSHFPTRWLIWETMK